MTGYKRLIFGIGCLASLLGYMTGASTSPVASVAIPAVFGLAVTAFAILQSNGGSKELIDLIKEKITPELYDKYVADQAIQSSLAAGRVGASLIVFSTSFLISSVMGAKIRIDNIFAPSIHQEALPWAKSGDLPPTVNAALAWMALRAKLIELGYDKASIDSMYKISQKSWQTTAAGASASPAASGSTDPQKALIDQFLKESIPANPLANQPTKDLKEKLEKYKTDPTGSKSELPS